MTKASKKISVPSLPVGPRREPLSKASGFRDEVGEFDSRGLFQRDIGSARSIGPRRAARLISPTRDVMRSRVTRRMV